MDRSETSTEGLPRGGAVSARAADESVVMWYKMLDDVVGERARTLRSDPAFDATFYDNMERLLRKAIADDISALSP